MGCHLIAPTPFIGYGSKKSGGMQSLYYFLTQKIVFGLARKFADMVLVSNKIDKQKLIDSGFSSDKVSVSYGGVNSSEIEETPDQEKTYDFIFIGRNHPQKGIDDLVLSWKEICAKKPNSKLAVVGGIENFIELKKKLFRHNLMGNVEFTGYLSGSSKYAHLKASKVLLFPSYYESFGMVALEALACGVPVVAYDLEVYREAFEDKLITVPRGNTTALAQAALNSLDLCKDSSFTNELKWFSRKFNFQKTSRSICEGLF
jgi:glycosyltransferase involved in cell wall biosynthesis